MILSIHDFPIKVENNCIKNYKDEILLDMSQSTHQELMTFIKENIASINDGKRVYKKRLTKTLSLYTFEEAFDIVKTEMFEKGYILSTPSQHEVEYNIIFQGKQSKKVYFNKIIINMEDNNKKEIQTHLESILTKIVDAKEESNVTKENKEIAVKDIIKFLNMYYNNLIQNKDTNLKGLFNEHQTIWFYAINKINKLVTFPLVKITNGLFRDYIITIFKSKGQEELLFELTGWSSKMLSKEKLTYDTKIILLSVNEILKDSNNE